MEFNFVLESCRSTRVMRRYKKRVPAFIKKIFTILENGEHQDWISWSPDGMQVIVKSPRSLEEFLLPKLFRHRNLNSFVRQLNMYNFKKQRFEDYDFVYAHPKFRRGSSDLLCQVERRKNYRLNQAACEEISDKEESLSDSQLNMEYQQMQKLGSRIGLANRKITELEERRSLLISTLEQQKREFALITMSLQEQQEKIALTHSVYSPDFSRSQTGKCELDLQTGNLRQQLQGSCLTSAQENLQFPPKISSNQQMMEKTISTDFGSIHRRTESFASDIPDRNGDFVAFDKFLKKNPKEEHVLANPLLKEFWKSMIEDDQVSAADCFQHLQRSGLINA